MAIAAAAANLCRGAGAVSISYSRRTNVHQAFLCPTAARPLLPPFSLRCSAPGAPFLPRLHCTLSADEILISSSPVPPANDASPPSDPVKDAADLLEIRVGQILKAWRHEEAESLYVEEVDVGEAEPRIICSGLVNYIPLEHLQGSKVVVLANLKPRNMRGVKSSGMLMAASDKAHENVELLLPPADSVPGERIWFGSEDEKDNQPDPASPNQIQKKKIWEQVQPHLKTDESCVAMLGEHRMRTSAGVVMCSSLKNASIS